jgi:methylenetetrahydrofolate dehydrogenase (NAD+)
LVGILADVGPFREESALYSERIGETFQDDDISYDLWKCHGDSPDQMEALIRQANADEDIHGIIVFYPVYPPMPSQQHNNHNNNTKNNKGPYKNRLTGVYYKTHDDYFRHVVDASKDVEGLSGTKWYHPQLLASPPLVYPCTALSVQRILEHYHPRPTKKEDLASRSNPNTTSSSSSSSSSSPSWNNQVVSVVNRSEIVGRPLAAMLADSGATVYSIDVDTILRFSPNGRLHRCQHTTTLEDCLAESNVVVTGVPHADFQIPTDYLAEGTTVVNVSEFTNVDEGSILARPDIKYIPQVGKVTVAVLEQNLVRLHQKRIMSKDS